MKQLVIIALVLGLTIFACQTEERNKALHVDAEDVAIRNKALHMAAEYGYESATDGRPICVMHERLTAMLEEK